jgi:endonuclease YncB( thermonuclease family)
MAFVAPAHAAEAQEACAISSGETQGVARVIDAETIALDDGTEVRLIGALPSRSLDAASDGSAVAAIEDAVRGRSVELRYGGRRSDRYGRRLAQVFAIDGDAKVWLQGKLVESGRARAYALPGNEACLKDLLAKEQLARLNGRGIWSDSPYRVRNSAQTRELLALRGRFAVVEGKVQQVAASGGRTYLNFGSDWKRDFTAAVPPAVMRAKPEAQKYLHSLEGRDVRVRGWIERRNGPLIELSSLDEIEVLGPPAASADPHSADAAADVNSRSRN